MQQEQQHLSTLHYKGSKGEDWVWSVYVGQTVDGDYYTRTETGMVNGKMRVSKPNKIRIGKRDVDPLEKARSEATTKWRKKNTEVIRKQKFKVMLAQTYNKLSGIPSTYTMPICIQPKLDGIRAFAVKQMGNVLLLSRNGNEIPNAFTAIKHTLYRCLPENVFFDGELYCHGAPRQKIAGICNRKGGDGGTNDIKIAYHVFDCMSLEHPDEIYIERKKRMTQQLDNNDVEVCCVQTHCIYESTHKALMAEHTLFIRMGYEGIIIRNPSSVYENKRSKNLLKYKEFMDDEFIICGYKQGHGVWDGAVIWECWYDQVNDKRFSVKMRGTVNELKRLYKEADKYIGKKLTVRYQSLIDGCPEFGIGIELDRQDI